jgi:methionine aminotransferase
MIELTEVTSKLPHVGTTIFTVMSKLANECNAINLSQGFPDFPVDKKLKELVAKNINKDRNQYAPMPGLMKLREAIATKTEMTYGRSYNPESEITVTAGATQAIYTAITALVHEGDEVVIFTPAYDCYAPPVELNHGKPVYVRLEAPDYRVNWDEVKKVMNRRTKLIIINTPHNPTGTIWEDSDMKQLERLVQNCNAFVLSDEVYEHIVFDGKTHQSVARYPELADRSITVSSFGKTFHATGWKLGYVCAPEYLMKEFRKVHQYLVFSVNTPIQYALAKYINDPDNYQNLGRLYEAKRDTFLKAIKPSRFKALPSAGTYFQLLSYEGISDKSEYDFAVELTKEYGVASIPVAGFYNVPLEQKVLRFCFAKSDETLLRGAEILNKI